MIIIIIAIVVDVAFCWYISGIIVIIIIIIVIVIVRLLDRVARNRTTLAALASIHAAAWLLFQSSQSACNNRQLY